MIKITKLWPMSVQPARWGQNKVIKIAHTVSASDRLALGIEKTKQKAAR